MKLDNSKRESSDLTVFREGPKDSGIKSEFNIDIHDRSSSGKTNRRVDNNS